MWSNWKDDLIDKVFDSLPISKAVWSDGVFLLISNKSSIFVDIVLIDRVVKWLEDPVFIEVLGEIPDEEVVRPEV